jgi:hypothetical protein
LTVAVPPSLMRVRGAIVGTQGRPAHEYADAIAAENRAVEYHCSRIQLLRRMMTDAQRREEIYKA